LDTELPIIKGDPKSDFTFNVTLRNNSASETLIDLYATVPQGFYASFKEQYGSKTINTLLFGRWIFTVDPSDGYSFRRCI
jgi:hypothetical protein